MHKQTDTHRRTGRQTDGPWIETVSVVSLLFALGDGLLVFLCLPRVASSSVCKRKTGERNRLIHYGVLYSASSTQRRIIESHESKKVLRRTSVNLNGNGALLATRVKETPQDKLDVEKRLQVDRYAARRSSRAKEGHEYTKVKCK